MSEAEVSDENRLSATCQTLSQASRTANVFSNINPLAATASAKTGVSPVVVNTVMMTSGSESAPETQHFGITAEHCWMLWIEGCNLVG